MRPLSGLFAAGLLAIASASAPSAATTLVSFIIDDTYPGGGAGVYSDAAVSGTGHYADYRIDPDPPLNWCVDAEPYAPGNLFVRLNRKLDGDAGVLRCTENPRDGSTELGTQRNFVLRIANAEACGILSDPDAGLPLTTDANGICTLAHNDNPRIRLGTLYKAKARTTTIDFLTVMAAKPNSYEIRSESAAAIASNGAFKTVIYDGMFRLVKFAPGQKARTVGPAFAMPLKIAFEQH
jgi:hypothetical protein